MSVFILVVVLCCSSCFTATQFLMAWSSTSILTFRHSYDLFFELKGIALLLRIFFYASCFFACKSLFTTILSHIFGCRMVLQYRLRGLFLIRKTFIICIFLFIVFLCLTIVSKRAVDLRPQNKALDIIPALYFKICINICSLD